MSFRLNELPLAALGIRALWKLCRDGLVYHALEQASDLQVEVGKRQVAGPFEAWLDLAPEGGTSTNVAKGRITLRQNVSGPFSLLQHLTQPFEQ